MVHRKRRSGGQVIFGLALAIMCVGNSAGTEVPFANLESKAVSAESVHVTLLIQAVGRVVIASLAYENLSHSAVYLNKINGCLSGELQNDVFVIMSGGRRLRYLLPLVKRRAPGPLDVVKLEAGRQLHARVRLDRAYGFFPGSRTYRAYYEGFHSDPNGGTLLDLKSNEVSFAANMTLQR